MKIQRELPTPGEILAEEFLKPLGLTQARLAAHIGCDVKIVNRIVNGRTSVSAEMAVRLGAALRTSPEFWLNAQQAVDIEIAIRSMKKIPEPIPPASVESARKGKDGRPRASAPGARKSASAILKSAVSLEAIVAAGLLRPPTNLMAQHRGQSLRAVVDADGSILFQGVRCASPSIAAGIARKSLHKDGLKGDRLPPTNGWTFWQIQDPASNEMVPLDTLRVRYLRRKKTDADRLRTRP